MIPLSGVENGDIHLSEFIRKSTDEFLFQTGLDDFLNSNFGDCGDSSFFA